VVIKKSIAGLIIVVSAYVFIAASKFDVFFDIKKNFTIFSDVFSEVSLRYVDEVEPGQLMNTGINAMLEMLDPYTVLIPEDRNQEMDIITKGKYAGVGLEISLQRGEIVVITAIEGYSADKKGVKTGDSIIEIEGIPTSELSDNDIEAQLYGEPGSVLEIKVKRFGVSEPISFSLERERIDVKSVPFAGFIDEDNGTVYIQLLQFSQNCAVEVKSALEKLNTKQEIKNIIFDVRNNPGGLLDEAVSILDLFLPAGLEVVRIKGRLLDNNQVFLTRVAPMFPDVNLIVLQNEGSASASEILAGALQDLDRALIIGERSFGKGLVQTIRPISYNNALKITSSRYFIPSGRSIQSLKYSHLERNEVSRIPDSLRQKFTTKNGRTVYDGTGIDPDVTIADKDPDLLEIALLKDSHYFFFANEYVAKNDTITEKSLKLKAFPAFREYLKKQNFTYKTNSDRNIDELIQQFNSNQAISELLKSLKSKVEDEKIARFDSLSKYIENQLFVELLTRYTEKKDFYPYILKRDSLTLKAIALLSDSKSFRSKLQAAN